MRAEMTTSAPGLGQRDGGRGADAAAGAGHDGDLVGEQESVLDHDVLLCSSAR